MNIRPFLYGALAYFGYKYVTTALALVDLSFNISGVKIMRIYEKSIILSVDFVTTNNKGVDLRFQRADLKAYFDGVHIANVNNPVEQIIPAHGSNILTLAIEISYQAVGDALWQSIINNNLIGFNLDLKGVLTVNNKPYPCAALFTINDIQDAVT